MILTDKKESTCGRVKVSDVLTPEQRHYCMSRIKGKNTQPELFVRSMLHRLGYRFRLHLTSLPGKPDIVLPKYKTVIFVHGCFWHRHEDCQFAYTPKSRADFWEKKFESNLARDYKVKTSLELLGWQVLIVWECELRSPDKLSRWLDENIKSGTKKKP